MAERIIAIIETTEARNDLSQARHDKSVIFDSSLYLGHSSSCFFSSSSLVVFLTSSLQGLLSTHKFNLV